MALQPQKFRELVFLLLYGRDMGHGEKENMVDLLSNELKITKKNIRDAQSIADEIALHLKEIDALITKTSHAYAFERIPGVERNILRQAIYSLLFEKELHYKIIISEALRLAKKFSTKEAATFVNAILDAIHKEQEGEKASATTITTSSKALAEAEKLTKEILTREEADE